MDRKEDYITIVERPVRKARLKKKEAVPKQPYKRPNQRRAAIARWKTFPRYEIPRSKLNQVLQFLEEPLAAAKPKNVRRCHGFIGAHLRTVGGNTGRTWLNKQTRSLMEAEGLCAARDRWTDFFRTIRLHIDHAGSHDVAALLRNTLFGIVADPGITDRTVLQSFLHANTYCKTKADAEYCIGEILRVLHGVTGSSDRGDISHSSTDSDSE